MLFTFLMDYPTVWALHWLNAVGNACESSHQGTQGLLLLFYDVQMISSIVSHTKATGLLA